MLVSFFGAAGKETADSGWENRASLEAFHSVVAPEAKQFLFEISVHHNLHFATRQIRHCRQCLPLTFIVSDKHPVSGLSESHLLV